MKVSNNLFYFVANVSLKPFLPITAYFELNWIDNVGVERILEFYPMMPMQYSQWVSGFEPFVERILRSTSIPHQDECDDDESLHTGISLILTGDEKMYERHRSTARPWSLIGRIGAHSESSSLVNEAHLDGGDTTSVLSANLLPGLFNGNGNGNSANSIADGRSTQRRLRSNESKNRRTHTRHRSAKSPLSSGFTRDDLRLDINTPKNGALSVPNSTLVSLNGQLEDERTSLPDLTGNIVKQGHYPIAHGGHSDVWKAMWNKGGVEVKVAVKVLRNTTGDPEKTAKMISVCLSPPLS
jgi:hypothetical protein